VTKTKAEVPTECKESSHIEPVMEEKAPEMADVAEKAVEILPVTGQLVGA